MKKIMSIFFVLMLCISLFGCSHEHNMEKTIISEASCVLKGSVKHYCTKCDYSYIEETKAKGHVYDDGCIDKEATCDTAGHKVFVCAVCGAKKEESISPSHSFSEEVTLEATCYNNGKKVLTCSVCGYQETEEIQSTGRHSFVGDTCINCDARRCTDFEADNWYTYQPLNIVVCQNCLITNAFIRNAGDVMVSYNPVCKNCQVVGNSCIAVVDDNYSHKKTYRCDCGENTYIIISIEY